MDFNQLNVNRLQPNNYLSIKSVNVEHDTVINYLKIDSASLPPAEQNSPCKSFSSRLDSLVARLRPELQQTLIDSDLDLTFDLENPENDYIGYLNSLNDQELNKTVSVLRAFSVNPMVSDTSQGNGFARESNQRNRSENFIDMLKGFDSDTQTRVLNKMSDYAEDVPVIPFDKSITYNKKANDTNQGAASEANDLLNFFELTKKSKDVNETIDKIESFTTVQQSDVMFIMSSVPEEQADRVFNILENKEKETQNEILKVFSSIAKRTSPLLSFSARLSNNSHSNDAQYIDTSCDTHDYYATKQHLSDTLSLYENFQFENDDLNRMSKQLNEANFLDQRALTTLSLTSLETLEGDNGSVDIPLKVSTENNDVLKSLQQTPDILNLVHLSQFGKELDSQHIHGASSYSLIKDDYVGQRDQQDVIQLLTIHAKTNLYLADRDKSLSLMTEKLLNKDAESRDQYVDDLLKKIPKNFI